MPDPNDEKIGIREFGRYINVSDTYVKKQMFHVTERPKGPLKESLTVNENNGRPMLYKELALTEWIAAGLTIKNPEVLAKMVPLIIQPQEQLWQDEKAPAQIVSTPPTPLKAEPLAESVSGNISENPQSHFNNQRMPRQLTADGNIVHADMNAYEAKAAKEVFVAGKHELEYRKMLGKLVEKDAVYAMLFEFGKEMREMFLQIPARIISQIMACETEREGIEVIKQEIERVLFLLSRGPKDENITNEDAQEPTV